MSALHEWMRQVRAAMRVAPEGTEVLHSITDDRVTIRLRSARTEVAVLTVLRAAPAPRDAKQLTLDALARKPAAAPPAPPADTPAADPPPPPATVAEPGVRVSIAESEWDALTDAARGMLSETHRGHAIHWQGAVGCVTALVPDDAMAALRGACEGYGVTLYEGDIPPITPRRAAAKAAAKPAGRPDPDAAGRVIVTGGASIPVDPDDGDEEYPDGPPYATVSVHETMWRRHAAALGDTPGGAHYDDWRRDPDAGDRRSCTMSRSQLAAVEAELRAIPGAWSGAVVCLLDDAPPNAPAHDPIDVPALAAGMDDTALSPDAPPPTKARAKKPAAKLFRDGPSPLDTHTHPNTAHLVIHLADDPLRTLLRPRGLPDTEWRLMVQHTLDASAGYEVARLYSAKGKCLWDSRDGGRP